MKNTNDFFIEMPFDMQSSAAGDLTDVHAREPFHALELNISALPACSRPRLSRQRRNVFDPVPLGDWDIFLAHPFFVAGFSVNHVNPVLSLDRKSTRLNSSHV